MEKGAYGWEDRRGQTWGGHPAEKLNQMTAKLPGRDTLFKDNQKLVAGGKPFHQNGVHSFLQKL